MLDRMMKQSISQCVVSGQMLMCLRSEIKGNAQCPFSQWDRWRFSHDTSRK